LNSGKEKRKGVEIKRRSGKDSHGGHSAKKVVPAKLGKKKSLKKNCMGGCTKRHGKEDTGGPEKNEQVVSLESLRTSRTGLELWAPRTSEKGQMFMGEHRGFEGHRGST